MKPGIWSKVAGCLGRSSRGVPTRSVGGGEREKERLRREREREEKRERFVIRQKRCDSLATSSDFERVSAADTGTWKGYQDGLKV